MDTNLSILIKLNVIFNHMILRDAHEAGLLPDDLWIEMLQKQLHVLTEMTEEEKNGDETKGG